MQARIATRQIALDKLEEFTQRWRELLLPALQQQPGVREAMLLVDPQTGKAVVVSVWESDAAMRAFEQGPVLANLRPRFADFLDGEPTVADVYEVRAHT